MGLLEGKVAIVTGGGSGIGRAVCVAFVQEGARVVFCGRREEAGRETLAIIRAAGGDAHFVQADISKSADVQRLVRATVERHGRLDAAFNNAGIGEASPKFADVSEDEYDHHFDVNARGTFFCMKYELRQMLGRVGRAGHPCVFGCLAM